MEVISYEEVLTNAFNRFSLSSDPGEQIRSILLAGALLPRMPELPKDVAPQSHIGLAFALEQAQWATMFDIARGAHRTHLRGIKASLGLDDADDMDPSALLGVALADQARGEDEKVIWGDRQYCEFTQDFYDNVGYVYTARVGQAVADYAMTSGDFDLALKLGDSLGFGLVEAAKQSALIRLQIFMSEGHFKRAITSFLDDDGALSMEPLVQNIGGFVDPSIDVDTCSLLTGWQSGEASVALELD